MIYFEKRDVDFLCKQDLANLNKCRRVMEVIDHRSSAEGIFAKENMSHVEANACYTASEQAILEIVPRETQCSRTRIVLRLKWGTVI